MTRQRTDADDGPPPMTTTAPSMAPIGGDSPGLPDYARASRDGLLRYLIMDQGVAPKDAARLTGCHRRTACRARLKDSAAPPDRRKARRLTREERRDMLRDYGAEFTGSADELDAARAWLAQIDLNDA